MLMGVRVQLIISTATNQHPPELQLCCRTPWPVFDLKLNSRRSKNWRFWQKGKVERTPFLETSSMSSSRKHVFFPSFLWKELVKSHAVSDKMIVMLFWILHVFLKFYLILQPQTSGPTKMQGIFFLFANEHGNFSIPTFWMGDTSSKRCIFPVAMWVYLDTRG